MTRFNVPFGAILYFCTHQILSYFNELVMASMCQGNLQFFITSFSCYCSNWGSWKPVHLPIKLMLQDTTSIIRKWVGACIHTNLITHTYVQGLWRRNAPELTFGTFLVNKKNLDNFNMLYRNAKNNSVSLS